jgi:hypothetical protein
MHAGDEKWQTLRAPNREIQVILGPVRIAVVPIKLARELTNGVDESKFIQGRWTKTVHEASYVADGRLGLRLELIEACFGPRWIGRNQVSSSIEFQGEPRENWTKTVVKVAA